MEKFLDGTEAKKLVSLLLDYQTAHPEHMVSTELERSTFAHKAMTFTVVIRDRNYHRLAKSSYTVVMENTTAEEIMTALEVKVTAAEAAAAGEDGHE